MFARWEIAVAGVDPTAATCDQVHGAVSAWVDHDHWASPKPWAAWAVGAADGVGLFEVATLNRQAAEILHSRVSHGRHVRLGSQSGAVVHGPQLLASADWDQLAGSDLLGPSAWCVEFVTPTALSRTFGRVSRLSPWPDPRSVARSLADRMNAVRPADRPGIALDHPASAAVWVSDVEGRNDVFSIKAGRARPGSPAGAREGIVTVSGFRGRIRYVSESDAATTTYGTLLQFAQFAGVGRYTTHGLGKVRLQPTWAP